MGIVSTKTVVEAMVSREFVGRLAHAMKTALVDSVPVVGIVDHWSVKETEEGLVRGEENLERAVLWEPRGAQLLNWSAQQ